MFRSEAMRRLARLMRVAAFCERRGISTADALGLAREAEERDWSRREFLRASAGAAAAVSLGLAGRAVARPVRGSPRIAIVGAGLAGLVCADTLLRRYGLSATIYEAHDRIGGRCFSLRDLVAGKVAENGGEFIDTTHKTMRAYANEFNLAREDVGRAPGEVAYFFDNQRFTDKEVVEEYRQLVGRMRPDLQASSGEPTFFAHNEMDVALDRTSLADYLALHTKDLPLARAAISEAYVAEYGLEPSEQSCLNMLLFLHLDKRRRFTPFGVFSDERFHLVGGNDAIATNIAARLPPERVQMGMKLTRLGTNRGEYELEFDRKGTRVADTVVLALPFTVLRQVTLDDPSLGLSVDKRNAIDTLGYGTNAKTMIAFRGKPWLTGRSSNGSAYTDLTNVQTTWETSPMTPGAVSILTDYAGGNRGADLKPGSVQQQVAAFLRDLESVYPGVSDAAVSNGSQFVAHLEHWPSNPLSQGSYTCYRVGQFTSVAGLEGQAAGRLKFAGEHTDSFYSWQGFMEGACLSGIRAAEEIVADIRAGVFS
jgi:monoamine oxidase